MSKEESDYLYEVWRRGGNPDAVDLDDVPRDFDWVWDEPRREHLPNREQQP
jgi:hypothetical protein